MTEPYPEYPDDDASWGEEFVRWGNRGVVCSFAPERPQRGCFTVLAEADFDLMLAPLVEYRIGRGRIVFCQLDVTSRYGRGPVPTRLVNRLLEYLTSSPGAPAATTVALQGGKITEELAALLTVVPNEEGEIMFAGPDWDGKPEDLAAFATGGGRVVIAGNSRPALAGLFGAGGISRQEVFKVAVPGPLRLRDVAPRDFFWREVKGVPVLVDVPADVRQTSPCVLAVRKQGKGEIVWCGLTPSDFKGSRQATRTLELLSTVLGSGQARPDMLAPEVELGKPLSPYRERSLDFNPYHYRRW